jgi:hypothetical protein
MILGLFLLYIGGMIGGVLLLRPVWRQWHLPMATPLTLFILFEILICILYLLLVSQSFANLFENFTVLSRRRLLFIPIKNGRILQSTEIKYSNK